MGGDNSPDATLNGAYLASKELRKILKELRKKKSDRRPGSLRRRRSRNWQKVGLNQTI